MSEITIRRLEKGDFDRVRAFFDGFGDETRYFFDRDGGHGNFLGALSHFAGHNLDYYHRYLALNDEGEMVGYVFLWDVNSPTPWLGIAVADGYKGQGLGKRLLETVKEDVKARGKVGLLLTTYLDNYRAQALYERFGFKKIGIHDGFEYVYLLTFE